MGVCKTTLLLQEDTCNSFHIFVWDHEQFRNLQEVVDVSSCTFE